MPYIKHEMRMKLLPYSTAYASTPGELNYQIAILVKRYLYKSGLSYATLNEIIGVLECAKVEFYQRAVTPYEEQKIEENGDVYGPHPEDI